MESALDVIENHHPQLLWVYLADVDSEGHSGEWNAYTSSIQTADDIVNTLWTTIQNDPLYKDKTTLFVTNDHGRHDNQHGGFQGHGCSCDGCQQIMFLAIGPNIKENYISNIHHELADAAVTASYILDVNPEYATGELISEIFKPEANGNNNLENDTQNHPQITIKQNRIELIIEKPAVVSLEIYDAMGRKMEIIISKEYLDKVSSYELLKTYSKGIYIAHLNYGNQFYSKKIYIN